MTNIDYNILNNDEQQPLSDDLLIKYAEGNATPEEQYLVEQYLSNQEMEADALEGLEQYTHKNEALHDSNDLRSSINQLVKARNQRKTKRKWKDNPQIYWIAFILFLMAISGYYIIKLLLKK